MQISIFCMGLLSKCMRNGDRFFADAVSYDPSTTYRRSRPEKSFFIVTLPYGIGLGLLAQAQWEG